MQVSDDCDIYGRGGANSNADAMPMTDLDAIAIAGRENTRS